MKLDTMPAAVGPWFAQLRDGVKAFLREHDLLIPFTFYGGMKPFVDGCLANAAIQRHLVDHPGIWTPKSIETAPEMRWEFDIVVAFGGFEVISWSKNKNWGPLGWIGPLQPDDEIDARFLGCFHKPNSPYQKKMNQRLWLRHKLGRFSGLVSLAMKASSLKRFMSDLTATTKERDVNLRPDKGQFSLPLEVDREEKREAFTGWKLPIVSEQEVKADLLKEKLGRRQVFIHHKYGSPLDAIRNKLGMAPDEFFKVAKGRVMLPPERFIDPQVEMFDKFEDEYEEVIS